MEYKIFKRPDFDHLSALRNADSSKLLTQLITIRTAERLLAEGRRDFLIGGPVHLSVGQEAVAVGISASLEKSDYVFGAHRSHAHILALGTDIKSFFSEILARSSGLCRGMGGSMHLWDAPNGFYGSVPIVAGTVPLAVGAALASKLRGESSVAVAYLGDGAVEEGVVHESLNFAQLNNLPIVFVVENNLYASHMHISERQTNLFTARFALANNMAFETFDGNDTLLVYDVARKAIARARAGEGPQFLEAFTYRWFGHVDWREDIDVGLTRSKTEVESWKLRDPVELLKNDMIREKELTQVLYEKLSTSIELKLRQLWNESLSSPLPTKDAITKYVYEL